MAKLLWLKLKERPHYSFVESSIEARVRVARELQDELQRAVIRAKAVSMPLLAHHIDAAAKQATNVINNNGSD